MQLTDIARDGLEVVRQVFTREDRRAARPALAEPNGASIAQTMVGETAAIGLDIASEGSAIFALLIRQHREVQALFAELATIRGQATKARERLLIILQDKLSTHMRLEEKVFYPEAQTVDEQEAREAREEHEGIKFALRRLTSGELDAEDFIARLTVLRESFDRHVQDEERQLFPKVRRDLGEQRLARLKLLFDRQLSRDHDEPKVARRTTSTKVRARRKKARQSHH